MYKILIDTTDRYKKSIKLIKDTVELDTVTGDLDITVTIAEILKRNSLKIADIDIFEANPGPGSFTGIKIGVTVANVLNWALGKKKISELIQPEYGSQPNIHKTRWLK